MRSITFCLTAFLCLLFQWVNAQQTTISGTVLSREDNTPLAGATVKVNGAPDATQTDAEGRFKLKATKGATLVISLVSYATKTIVVTDELHYQVLLEPSTRQLDSIVVTSFGIKRDKKTLGYGVSSVKADEIRRAPVSDLTNALAGKVAGVQVSGTGGGFSSSNIIIRGFTTFTQSNQPLIVVDGVPIDNSGGGNSVNTGVSNTNRTADINPEDVESMSILKGAAATVLYGSRAASGAILITTKKGKKGTGSRLALSSNIGVGAINRFPKFQNEYAQGDRGIYKNNVSGSWGPQINGQTVTNWFGKQDTLRAYPNNVHDILQHSITNQNDISFTGASDKFSYRLAYGNGSESALVPGNKLNKNNFSVNLNAVVNPKLRVGAFLNYTSNISDRTQAGNQGSNPLWRGIYTPRSYNLSGLPYEDAYGNQLWFAAEDQPYWAIAHVKYHQEVNRIFGNMNLTYDFTPWLHADLKVGADVYSDNNQGFDDKGIRGNGNTSSAGKGGLIDRQNLVRNINSYFTVSGDRKLGEHFNLTATVGNEIIVNYARSLSATGLEIVVPGFSNLKNFVNYNTADSYTRLRTTGFFGDVALDYNNYLTVNLKARNDFSSTLTQSNRSIFYPAVAVSFVPTQAFPALKGKVLSSAKIRANIGEVGKGATVYSTKTYYVKASAGDGFGSTGISFPFNGLAGYTYSNSAGNANITPEFTREIELGGEFGFFNNRLFIDASVYKRDTRHLIFNVPVPGSSGFTSVTMNAGRLSTKGIELMVSGTPIKSTNFRWDASLNFTSFRSTVKELAPGVNSISIGGFTSPDIELIPGEEYGQIYSTAYKRNSNGQMIIGTDGLPIVDNGVKNIGNPNPRFSMGLTNSFTYKGFSLSIQVDGRYKGSILSRTIGDLRINGVSAETAKYPRFNSDGTPNKPFHFDGVLENGQPNNINVTAQDYFSTKGKYVAWEGYVLDASYIKLREVNLSYTLPASLLARTKFISAVQVAVFGRNLLTYAPHYPDLDPEQNLLGVSNATGLEFGIQPVARTIGGSVRIIF